MLNSKAKFPLFSTSKLLWNVLESEISLKIQNKTTNLKIQKCFAKISTIMMYTLIFISLKIHVENRVHSYFCNFTLSKKLRNIIVYSLPLPQ